MRRHAPRTGATCAKFFAWVWRFPRLSSPRPSGLCCPEVPAVDVAPFFFILPQPLRPAPVGLRAGGADGQRRAVRTPGAGLAVGADAVVRAVAGHPARHGPAPARCRAHRAPCRSGRCRAGRRHAAADGLPPAALRRGADRHADGQDHPAPARTAGACAAVPGGRRAAGLRRGAAAPAVRHAAAGGAGDGTLPGAALPGRDPRQLAPARW